MIGWRFSCEIASQSASASGDSSGDSSLTRHGARFESQSAGTMTFSGPVRVARSWLAPLGVKTDVVLGHDSAFGNEEVVLTTSWRSASEVIRALQSAGIQVQIRRKLF